MALSGTESPPSQTETNKQTVWVMAMGARIYQALCDVTYVPTWGPACRVIRCGICNYASAWGHRPPPEAQGSDLMAPPVAIRCHRGLWHVADSSGLTPQHGVIWPEVNIVLQPRTEVL